MWLRIALSSIFKNENIIRVCGLFVIGETVETLGVLTVEDAAYLLSLIFERFDLRFFHIHSLVSFPRSYVDVFMRTIKARAIRYYCTLHDYHWICPSISLMDYTGHYCGEPGEEQCQACVNRTFSDDKQVKISSYRAKYQAILKGAEACIVPNADVRKRMQGYFADVRFVVRPHPQNQNEASHRPEGKEQNSL